MTELKKQEFWFVVGSQLLYGAEVLETVAKRANEMAARLSESLPCKLVYKGTIKSSDEATQIMKDANYAEECCGVMTWCHTFSPSKMWIEGLRLLQKPYCHFATQYNRSIPDNEIDMDFMNLNQSAHGDREHGFLGARMRMARKVVVGYWQDEEPIRELGEWMRAAVGCRFSRNLRILRFGDNMREVAVTEGDKVEAQIKLGWMVNTWPVGYLVEEMAMVTEAEIEAKMAEYRERYAFNTDDLASVRYQALEEVAMKRIFEREKIGAFSNTFQDLYGMKQLPGLASQNLMADRIGYGGEGDWKVAGMTAVIMAMTEGMSGGTTFIEDYTYNLEKGKEYSLGAHMLEVGPSIAAERPKIEVHPLGIGDREAPARLVFEGKPGKAIVATLIDMGGRMRLILQDIECVKPIYQMRNLPVARVMWRAMPDLCTGTKLWILAGGAHHSVLTYDASAEMLADFAEMNEIEFVHITKDTTVEGLKQQLFLNDLAWKLKC
ncbi:MAG TPA: L-arabinose isomerase [Candidatus Cryosericum sp.]|nr:L-arabinose isomerase [Candidatus Cryosericum sp.]